MILLALAILLVGLAPASHAKLNDPQELVPFLKIELPGWKLGEGYPQAKRMQDEGRSFLQAEEVFSSGKSTVTVIIKEGEIAKEVEMFKAFQENDNEKGYCRRIKVQGFKAVELIIKELKNGFLFILVTDNCGVFIKGTEAENTKVLMNLANKMDLPKLAALVK